MNDVENEIKNGYKLIPSWFFYFVTSISGVFAVTVLPWSVYITITIFDHEARLRLIDDNTKKISIMEKTLYEQEAKLQVIWATRFTTENMRAIESRLERLETKLDNMKEEINNLRGKKDLLAP